MEFLGHITFSLSFNRRGKGKGVTIRTLFMLITFITGITAGVAFAGTQDPNAVIKTYKRTEKTCKQMERDHKNMQGEHKLMFKAWQEKSAPLLTEHEKVIAECRNTLSSLKSMSNQLDKTVSDSKLIETLFNDYEKIQDAMEDITVHHKTLREKHERLFHEMMGH